MKIFPNYLGHLKSTLKKNQKVTEKNISQILETSLMCNYKETTISDTSPFKITKAIMRGFWKLFKNAQTPFTFTTMNYILN